MTVTRGSTPTHYFEVPYDRTQIRTARVSYIQNGQIVILKKGDQIELRDGLVLWKLSQEDTLLLQADAFVGVQLKLLIMPDEVDITEKAKLYVLDCEDEEVMV